LLKVPGKVLFLAPWRQLVYQAHERLSEHDIPAGILMGARKPGPDDRVHVASIQTASRRDLGDYPIVVVDEAHRALARNCRRILEKFPRAKVLGLTATPIRLDGQRMDVLFDTLFESATHSELVRQGFLVPMVVFGRDDLPNLRGVRVERMTRDYAPRALANRMGDEKLLGDALSEYSRLAIGQPAWVYCCTIKHAEEVAARYNKAGFSADVMTGSTSATKRREMLEKMDAGELRIIANCAVLTEGVDYPPLKVIQLLRPTLSLSLHLQIIGRACRTAPGKSRAIILDHAGNFARHGFADEARDWLAEGRKQKKQSRGSQANKQSRVKKCPACQRLVPVSARRCPHCGYEWLPKTKPGKLVKLEPNSRRTAKYVPLR
jgi:superfamily II DNA or RNA helicase